MHSLILIDNECPISWKYAHADIYSNVTSDLLNASTIPSSSSAYYGQWVLTAYANV